MKNKFVKIEADYVVDQCMYTLTNHQQDLLYWFDLNIYVFYFITL